MAALAGPVDRPQHLGRGGVLPLTSAGLAGGGAGAGLAVGGEPLAAHVRALPDTALHELLGALPRERFDRLVEAAYESKGTAA